jgi:hypothetical protein
MVPCATLNVVPALMFPEASVWTSCVSDGAVHPTPRGLLIGEPSATVGSLGVLLHSMRFPIELAVYAVPVTATIVPALKPVLGVTVKGALVLAAANADTVPPKIVSPVTISAAAPNASGLVIGRRLVRARAPACAT